MGILLFVGIPSLWHCGPRPKILVSSTLGSRCLSLEVSSVRLRTEERPLLIAVPARQGQPSFAGQVNLPTLDQMVDLPALESNGGFRNGCSEFDEQSWSHVGTFI